MNKLKLKEDEFKKKFGYDSVDLDKEEPREPAIARKDGKVFHINRTTGKPLYEERFDWISHFNKGISIVRKNGNFFDIGKDGKTIQPKN